MKSILTSTPCHKYLFLKKENIKSDVSIITEKRFSFGCLCLLLFTHSLDSANSTLFVLDYLTFVKINILLQPET